MLPILTRLGVDFLNLVAPALCPGCDEPLELAERSYCNACRASLEPAPFPREIFMEVADRFPGEELALEAIGSLYSFIDGSPAQRLIHALKYNGCYGLGVEMGRDLGEALMMFREFEMVELVVPVPLHSARRRERGYNQAEAIAEGLTQSLAGSRVTTALERRRHTRSQTTLDARTRRRNVSQVFHALGGSLRDRTILLCDDVCTTGATLNACAEALLTAGAKRVVAATVAKDVRE